MINLSSISKKYVLGEDEVYALRNVTLKINEKEFVGILGSSGSGKSTLMHIIGLLDLPTSGKVKLFGKDVLKLSDDEISQLRNEYVGFVFQQFNLINKFTVEENVLLPAKYAKHRLKFNIQDYGHELMKRFGILDRRRFFPNKISGGQQQRVAIARALIMKPKLILADEPTGNLDTKTGDEILKILRELNKELGVTVVVVTHEPDIARRTERQIFVRDGEIVQKYL